ncbi:cache domain-containing sensor histidine kinase [Paenibacillus beijingensis]|uniref:HAMP domain-containing protein n=1 Tax=Paenibacillus beijingensis TaxID=1126833 RepID=A0A0D5NPY2_9BACL|nr:sensor histidine kinase [Paenibacillus beijingensis]AJY76988.1 hypothetical protein VN24_23560 [Paenibacillus beijingensis]
MIRIKMTHRIATKMVAALLAVIMIPTVFIGVAFYHASSAIVKNSVRQSSLQVAEQAADSLSNILNVGSDTSDLVYSQITIQKMVMQEFRGISDDAKMENKNYISNFLNNIIYSSSFVKIIYILEEQGTSWGSGIFNQAKVDLYNLRDFSWILEAERLDGQLAWTGLQYDKFSGAGDNTDLVIPAARVLKDFNTMKNIGYVVINIDGKSVLNKISQIRLGKTGRFFVVDKQGNIMIDQNFAQIGFPVASEALQKRLQSESLAEFEYEQDGTRYYGVMQPLSNGWRIVGVVPLHEITGQLEWLHNSVFIWSCAFALIAVAIGLFFARRITNPIQKLTEQMKLAGGGDLNVRTTVDSSDEIGLMSKQFNRMLYKLDQLMAQVRDEQQKKQRAEMRAVMHRINPHFMFNTLSTVKWLIKFGENDKAYEGISAFTRLLEANMGKKGHMVTIEEEVDIIVKFLAILQLRYNLTFKLDVRMEPEASRFLIPRMLMQPVVENSIFHGFVPENRNGTIQIAVLDLGYAVSIRIADNGMGMEVAKHGKLEGRAPESNEAGIGLRHVYECLQLYYPPGSKMDIESTPGEGAVISLLLMKAAPQAAQQQGEQGGKVC